MVGILPTLRPDDLGWPPSRTRPATGHAQQRHPPAAPGAVPGPDRRGRPPGAGRRRRRPGGPYLVPGPPAGRPRAVRVHTFAAQLATGPALAVARNSHLPRHRLRWSAPSARWSWSRRGGCPRWTSCACTRARSGAGTGPSTTRPRAATCASSCAPARQADRGRHGGQRRLRLGLTLALAPRPATGPGGWPSSRPTTPLPGRPAGPRGRAGLAAGPGGQVRTLPAASWSLPPPHRPPGPGGRRRARRGSRPAAGGDRGPGGHRPDRRRLAAPGPGRPGGQGARGTSPPRAGGPGGLPMLERYLDLQRTSDPVHSWPLPAA